MHKTDVLPRTSRGEGAKPVIGKGAKLYLLVGTVAVSCIGFVGLAAHYGLTIRSKPDASAAAQAIAELPEAEQEEVKKLVLEIEAEHDDVKARLLNKEVQILHAEDHPGTEEVDETLCALALGTVTGVVNNEEEGAVSVLVDLPPTKEELEAAVAEGTPAEDVLGQQCSVPHTAVRLLTEEERVSMKVDAALQQNALEAYQQAEEGKKSQSVLSKALGAIRGVATTKNLAIAFAGAATLAGAGAVVSSRASSNSATNGASGASAVASEEAAPLQASIDAARAASARHDEELSETEKNQRENVLQAVRKFWKETSSVNKGKYAASAAVLSILISKLIFVTPVSWVFGTWFGQEDN